LINKSVSKKIYHLVFPQPVGPAIKQVVGCISSNADSSYSIPNGTNSRQCWKSLFGKITSIQWGIEWSQW